MHYNIVNPALHKSNSQCALVDRGLRGSWEDPDAFMGLHFSIGEITNIIGVSNCKVWKFSQKLVNNGDVYDILYLEFPAFLRILKKYLEKFQLLEENI